MGDKKKFDSWQSGDHAESVATYYQCQEVSDAALMERILTESTTSCPARAVPFPKALVRRLKEQGIKVLLINTLAYQSVLTECEQCSYFKGDLPTWEEVQPRKK